MLINAAAYFQNNPVVLRLFEKRIARLLKLQILSFTNFHGIKNDPTWLYVQLYYVRMSFGLISYCCRLFEGRASQFRWSQEEIVRYVPIISVYLLNSLITLRHFNLTVVSSLTWQLMSVQLLLLLRIWAHVECGRSSAVSAVVLFLVSSFMIIAKEY